MRDSKQTTYPSASSSASQQNNESMMLIKRQEGRLRESCSRPRGDIIEKDILDKGRYPSTYGTVVSDMDTFGA